MDEKTLIVCTTTLALSVMAAFVVKDLLSKISGAAVRSLSKSFSTSIEVQCREGVRTNVVDCLNHLIKHYCGRNLRHFAIVHDIFSLAMIRRHSYDYDSFDESMMEEERLTEEPDVTGDLNKHLEPIQYNKSVFFFHKRTLIGISRRIIPELRNYHTPTEIYTITAYGTRNKQILIKLLDEARKKLEKKPSKHINYFKYSLNAGSFQAVRRFQPRALSSIVLKDGIMDAIQKDLEEFIESHDWYKERGIPYRRGYLLYGPPGCGKTSFVKAIAGQIGYDMYEVQLSNNQLTDECLNLAISSLSKKAILLFEDIDAVFVPRMQDEENSDELDAMHGKLKVRESKGALSFSGLLNAIDGVASEEDYIIFMTTNQIEKLDSALIRPGRIDMRQLIDSPDEQQIVAFFRNFYPNCGEGLAETFARAVTNLNCKPSIAQIQGIFLKHKRTPEDNLQDVETLIEICKSNSEVGHIYM